MLDFSITDFKLSHGFSSKNGLINGHIGSFFKNFFYVAFFVMCGTMGYLFHVWGGVSDGLFFLVISISTVFFLFWEGNWNNLQLNNCFWKIWWP